MSLIRPASTASSSVPARMTVLLMVKLKKATWRKDTRTWKGLLRFSYRTQQEIQPINLRHRLTPTQLCILDTAIVQSDALAKITRTDDPEGKPSAAMMEQMTDAVDQACLDLCISLLVMI